METTDEAAAVVSTDEELHEAARRVGAGEIRGAVLLDPQALDSMVHAGLMAAALSDDKGLTDLIGRAYRWLFWLAEPHLSEAIQKIAEQPRRAHRARARRPQPLARGVRRCPVDRTLAAPNRRG